MNKAKSHFPLIIKNSPKSLKFIIQFYRFFGLTYSCVLFEDEASVQFSKAKSVLLLAYNVFTFFSTIYFFLISICLPYLFPGSMFSFNVATAFNSTENPFFHEMLYGQDEFFRSFRHFKPVGRGILQALIFIFSADYVATYPFSLFKGGRLLRRLVRIPNIQAIDSSKAFAVKLLFFSVATSLGASIAGFVLFNRRYISLVYRWIFLYAEGLSATDAFNAKRGVLVTLFYPFYILFESSVTFLFVYAMHIFKRNLQLHVGTVDSVAIDHQQLRHLKVQLSRLGKHFRGLIQCISTELTVINLINIYLLITAACFFMAQSAHYQYYAGIMFSFGALGATRMLLVCCAANWVTEQYERLDMKLTDSKVDWPSEEWICLMEIRRLQKQFRVTIWSVYTVNNGSILAMIVFVLNYIVVLLQTENFTAQEDSSM